MFISAQRPGSEKSEEEIEEFWNELSECVGSFGRNVVGGSAWGFELLDMCAEQELVVGNSWFKKNYVYKCTWLRMAEGTLVDNTLVDYVLIPRRMLGRLLDVKVWRGEGLSDHFLVEARLKLVGGWRSEGRMEGVRNVLKVSELKNSVKERAYQESLRGKYEVWRGGDVESVEKVWEKFRDIVMECTNDIHMWHETCRRAEKKWE